MKNTVKKLITFTLVLIFSLGIFSLPSGVFAESEELDPNRELNRSEAAVLLDDLFGLADVKALNLRGFETTPKNLGYEATNGAITSDNVIPAAKDSVQFEESTKIEAVINAGLLELQEDGMSFMPTTPVTREEFIISLAKGYLGADLELDFANDDFTKKLSELAEVLEVLSEEKTAETNITFADAEALVSALKEQTTVISIFATSDIHGNYIPYTSSDANFEIGSAARIKTIMDEVRADIGEESVLYFDGGDSPYNTTLANVTKGDVSVATLDALGLNATVLGNHDFDYSFENLLRLAEEANYKILASNTRYKEDFKPENAESVYPEQFEQTLTIEVGDFKIGVFGVTDDLSAATTLYMNTEEIEFDPDLEAAEKMVKQLSEEGCDYIIALSHLHSKNPIMVENLPEVKLSIGGGNDIAGKPTIINDDQYLINPGKHGEAITQINLVFYENERTGTLVNQLFLTEAYEEDKEVKALVDKYNEQVSAALDATIGYLGQNLEWSPEHVRTQNSPIANLVTDALLAYFQEEGAEICIVNGGGIRAAMGEGEVSMRDVTSVLPFDNNMMVVETSGQTIWDAIQNGISAWPATNGKFPQVAGMTYSFQSELGEEGESTNTLKSITLADGSTLDLEAKYKVVINSFIAGGGDGYTMFNVLDENKEMATDVEQLVFLHKTYMRHALQEYFEKNSSTDAPITIDVDENRIEITE